jgi:putative endonuclease
VKFLEHRGLTLLARNYRRRTGELDVVMRAPQSVVIVEVRSRSSDRFGGAAASVGFRKRQRILRTSAQFLQSRKDLAALPVRFDVLVVHAPLSERPRLEWIQHAF